MVLDSMHVHNFYGQTVPGVNMESNDELKEIYIINHICYYFDVMIKIENFDFDSILLDKKSYRNNLIYHNFYDFCSKL